MLSEPIRDSVLRASMGAFAQVNADILFFTASHGNGYGNPVFIFFW